MYERLWALGTAMTDGLCDKPWDSLLTNDGGMFSPALSRSLPLPHSLLTRTHPMHTRCCSKGSRTMLQLCGVLVSGRKGNTATSLTALRSGISTTIFTSKPQDVPSCVSQNYKQLGIVVAESKCVQFGQEGLKTTPFVGRLMVFGINRNHTCSASHLKGYFLSNDFSVIQGR